MPRDVALDEWVKNRDVKIVHTWKIRNNRPPFLSDAPELKGTKIKDFVVRHSELPTVCKDEIKECVTEHQLRYCQTEISEEQLNTPLEFHILQYPSLDFVVGVNLFYTVHIPSVEFLSHTLCNFEHPDTRKIPLVRKVDTDCIVFGHHWSDGFQHGTQDIFPYIASCADWLIEHPEVTIVMPKNPDVVWWLNREGLFGKLQNNIIMMDYGYVTSTKKLYGITITPGQLCEFTPWGMFRYSPAKLHGELPKDKYLIYFCREGTLARAPVNKSEIIEVLEEYCLDKKLELKVVNPSVVGREGIERMCINAKGVVAPHGGANYNVLFMKRNSKEQKNIDKGRFFIEFVAKEGCHHTYHIALAARVNYLAIPCNGGHYTKNMHVNIEALRKSLGEFE